jgi:uncharacterized repeat protein (TIGR02543 family)
MYHSFNVKYDANGGTGAPASYKTHVGISSKLSSSKPTRANYTFLGWSTSKTATKAKYAAGTTYLKKYSTIDAGGSTSKPVPEKDVTLFAVWKEQTYTVSYSANGGSGAPATKEYGKVSNSSVKIDSGSNLNTTTNYVLNDGGITSKHTGMRSSLTSVAGTKITDLMTVNFDLLSIGDKIGEVKTNNYSTEFQVINNSKYIIEGTKDIPPVSAIIGAEFLLENKWVIDFSSGAVYSAKKQQK